MQTATLRCYSPTYRMEVGTYARNGPEEDVQAAAEDNPHLIYFIEE